MRIVLAARRAWPAIGGVERVLDELALAFRLEHEVSIVAQRIDPGPHGRLTHLLREPPSFAAVDREGIPVRQFRLSRRRRTLLLPLALEKLPGLGRLSLRAGRRVIAPLYARLAAAPLLPLLREADVVHVLGGEWLAAAVVGTCRWLGIPVVVTPFMHPGEWGGDVGSLWAYRRADRVLATLETDAQALASIGVSRARIEVCGLPCPGLARGAVAIDDPRLPPSAPLVVFVGDRRPNKGVDLLMAAASHVWAAVPEAHFAFVGPGAPLGARDERIIDVGLVSDGERSAWLERSSLLSLPSASETFGLVVAEAWSVGRPVVLSDIAPLRALVASSDAGVNAPRRPETIAEAILALLQDPARARAMGERGRAFWHAHYSPEVVAARHLDVYRRVIAEARGRRLRARRLPGRRPRGGAPSARSPGSDSPPRPRDR